MHHDTFNADFYVTAATVIPILYLALTLQGRTYEDIVNAVFGKIRRNYIAQAGVRSYIWLILAVILSLAAVAIVVFGITGEWEAILALYNHYSTPGGASWVLFASIILMIAVGIGPIIRFWRPIVSPTEDIAKEAGQRPDHDSREIP